MSKGLSTMSPGERAAAVARRLQEKQGGLGYLAALDAKKKIEGQVKKMNLVTQLAKTIAKKIKEVTDDRITK